jgi:quercetin dioxygenase-like cupin family protein
MNTGVARWVLGHLVKPLETGGQFALLEIVSRPGVPGPPPHHHEDIHETFYVVRGQLDLSLDGHWRTLTAGDHAIAPAGTVHTFINNGSEDALWLTTFTPLGFETFFDDFGVADLSDAGFHASVAVDVLARVAQDCERYGMIVRPAVAG